eukprot:scaffold1900_cov123-Cylindrotheca_fusiformis.AAC.5
MRYWVGRPQKTCKNGSEDRNRSSMLGRSEKRKQKLRMARNRSSMLGRSEKRKQKLRMGTTTNLKGSMVET